MSWSGLEALECEMGKGLACILPALQASHVDARELDPKKEVKRMRGRQAVGQEWFPQLEMQSLKE
jgi:hypothetical protein